MKYSAKIDIRPVAYRGTTALIPDLLAGRIDVVFGNVVNMLSLMNEGRLRGFAVTSLKRSAVAPNVPTMAESGYPGFEAVPWFGLMAPAGTPQPIIDKLHLETVRVLALPDVGASGCSNSASMCSAARRRNSPTRSARKHPSGRR